VPTAGSDDVWSRGARRAVDATVDAGIGRFVMVSSLGAGDPLRGPEALRPYLVAKRVADDHLSGTDLDFTILRPGRLTDEPGTGRIATRVEGFPAISREDVAATIVECLTAQRARRTTLEIVSGETPIPEALAVV
jgi:uncharacterized protein YbjT (DUF2867 family)